MYAHDNVCQKHELIYVIGHANVYLHLLSLQIEGSYVENLFKATEIYSVTVGRQNQRLVPSENSKGENVL